jgi:hypothetical protein
VQECPCVFVFLALTRAINGGLNGLDSRRQYWDRNRQILGLPLIDLKLETGKVIAFQSAHGLQADGAVGPRTMAALAA